jgi:hypothetical protein
MSTLTDLAEEVQLLTFVRLKGDGKSLATLSRVNRTIHRLTLPFLYENVDIGTLHVLLERPELARFALTATTIWDEYTYEHYRDGSPPRMYGMNRLIELTDEQAHLYDVDDRARVALLTHESVVRAGLAASKDVLVGTLPPRTALLLRICENLLHVRAGWSNTEMLERGLIPRVTHLELAGSPRLPLNTVMGVSRLVRLMLLPHLRAISCDKVLDLDRDDMDVVKFLRGRSTVEELAISNSFNRMECLYELLLFPSALVTFKYQHSNRAVFDLHVLTSALARVPTLQHIDVTFKKNSPSSSLVIQGDLYRLGELPALRLVRLHARLLFYSAVDEQTLQECLRRVPQVQHLAIVALDLPPMTGYPTQGGASALVRGVLGAQSGGPLRVLELAMRKRYTPEDIVELEEEGTRHSIKVVVNEAQS